MSEKTRKLLTDLGANPNLVDKFKKDPTRVMVQYEVPEDHQKMIIEGDKDGLKKAAGLDEDTLQFIIF